ncbi:cyclic peptide export ABC transporter [Paenibacillus sp. chi10]|uniref:Cyclic peptide export ABC transporter n=1 Tax=Paenibacillus suaedae TaxID=3077233 RepID=A0AAJ2N451_9BACL|nr:cyclic peptide export ABC transporter [Paenibacillus sp. chi10]MDT8977097.1 cyclic peptide export ABC transporter [Paenibacillus sp. chi10]
MNIQQKLVLGVAAMMMLSCLLTPLFSAVAQPADRKEQLDHYLNEMQENAKIPGMAVVVVQGEKIVYEQFLGYSDVKKKLPVTANTVFEMGSNSKAFTGLAVLQLEKQGLIKLTDPVSNYLPWFYMNDDGKRVNITIEQLLHHTSAIPPDTIGHIPASNADDALEQTVRMLVGKELWHDKRLQPGEYFIYSTINYDILGLIIQEVAGMPFEDFMQDRIIRPLGLGSTFMHYGDAVQNGLATGYKLGFLRPHAYQAPRYRGNIPAGYVNSTPTDIAKWMSIQLGAVKAPGIDANLIQLSHEIDNTVSPNVDGSSYAAGWSIYQSGGGEIAHGGSNPNFSSYIVMRNDGQLGVAVMANMNSDHTEVIARGVMSIMHGRTPVAPMPDTFSKVDKIASVVLVVFGLVLLALLFFIGRCMMEIGKGKRRWTGVSGWKAARLTAALFFLTLYLVGLYLLPRILFDKLPWSALIVWAPYTLVPAIIAAAAFGVIYTFYHLLTQLFAIKREKPYVSLLMLGMVSGFGNAFIIFVVNQSFGRNDNLTNGLLFYFALGILMYVYGQRYISTKLVILTNNLVYDKRTELIGKILKTPYEKLERMEDGRLHAVLNNDTETVSRSINVMVAGTISLVTLICCFIYLGMLSLYALFLSIGVIVTMAGLYFFLGSKAEKLWEETREIQTVFFRLINDMLKGFKELRLSQSKKNEFEVHVKESSNTYRIKRTEGDVRFANVNIAGELLFTVVIGTVAFLFPLFFPNLLTTTVQIYVFVFLYMAGPVNGILNAYPMFLQVRISWNRIQELSSEVALLQSEHRAVKVHLASDANVELVASEICYGYTESGDAPFTAGPFDLTCRSGTITFITGGNGSGKTTLAKLITGLYKPVSGHIAINGEALAPEELGSCFSAIFSDYYLFERLYGIDCSDKEDQIASLLHRLQLEDKVTVRDGCFSTTSLSTGQKKRLALLLTYLEDKPICLFDEWAADQDPEYRRHFYHEILPELKAQGKCIIAITHDDRYFHVADTLIKLERGKQMQHSDHQMMVEVP